MFNWSNIGYAIYLACVEYYVGPDAVASHPARKRPIDAHQIAHEVAHDLRHGVVTIEQIARTIQGHLLGILQYLSVFGEPKVLGIVGSALTHIIQLEKSKS